MYTENINPTPIHILSERFNNNTFFIKRDDLIPFSFGGNKARKAVLFFEDLRAKGCDSVVTYGSSNSNHCRIVSNIAASKGLLCYIVSPVETYRSNLNSKMIELFGAKVIRCSVSEVRDTIDKVERVLKNKGYNPYFIPGGGHGKIGTHAYVNAYKEIKKYENDRNLHFDYIFHPSGTGTTQAGLICGLLIYGGKKKIIGMSIARRNPYGGKVVHSSVNEYLMGMDMEYVTFDHINFIDDYVLDGYGMYNDAILETIKQLLIKDGIPLDTTYTGKAFWGMKEYIKKNQIKGKNILFIHTGGTPLFFNNLGELKNE
ncbi:MAG: pyridoxal-phosphate dependent enzyme [Clostridiales bacterium]|nr:pyridoxal-phosphate dependent enzyme [Clostridiales bacterium]